MIDDWEKSKQLHNQCCSVVCSSDTTNIYAPNLKSGRTLSTFPISSLLPDALGLQP